MALSHCTICNLWLTDEQSCLHIKPRIRSRGKHRPTQATVTSAGEALNASPAAFSGSVTPFHFPTIDPGAQHDHA